VNTTSASPSVCAGATWIARISSPLRCSVTPSPKVTTGSATAGEAGTFFLMKAMNWSLAIRVRTLSWATMTTPAAPKLAFPPVWSPCQWVLMMNRTGAGVSALTAAMILGVSSANSSSTRIVASGPVATPMLPPEPNSAVMPGLSGCG
jgi:hypothetical protein